MTKRVLAILCLLFVVATCSAEDRFGRPVIKVKDSNQYKLIKLDDVKYPVLTTDRYTVSCLVYRGTQHYYVEVAVLNNSDDSVALPIDFIAFDKPGYSVYRSNSLIAAREAAQAAGERFTPVPPPYVPPTYNTTINATSTTYGNETYTSGTATTTADDSGQAGANLGNAIGNAIAAHRFYKMQRDDVALSAFLASHLQTDSDLPLQSKQSRIIAATFDQPKQKKHPFTITVKVGTDTFHFEYDE